MREITEMETRTVSGGLMKSGGFFSSLWGDIEGFVSEIFGGGGGGDPLPTSCTPEAQQQYVNAFSKAGATTGAIESLDSESSMGAIVHVFGGEEENRQSAIENIKRACKTVYVR